MYVEEEYMNYDILKLISILAICLCLFNFSLIGLFIDDVIRRRKHEKESL